MRRSPTVPELFESSVTSLIFIYPPPTPTSLSSLAMFYAIALAGAHKKVINQLREQLAMVGLPRGGEMIVEPCDLWRLDS